MPSGARPPRSKNVVASSSFPWRRRSSPSRAKPSPVIAGRHAASSSVAADNSRSASSHAPRHMHTDAYCVRHTANNGRRPHFLHDSVQPIAPLRCAIVVAYAIAGRDQVAAREPHQHVVFHFAGEHRRAHFVERAKAVGDAPCGDLRVSVKRASRDGVIRRSDRLADADGTGRESCRVLGTAVVKQRRYAGRAARAMRARAQAADRRADGAPAAATRWRLRARPETPPCPTRATQRRAPRPSDCSVRGKCDRRARAHRRRRRRDPATTPRVPGPRALRRFPLSQGRRRMHASPLPTRPAQGLRGPRRRVSKVSRTQAHYRLSTLVDWRMGGLSECCWIED